MLTPFLLQRMNELTSGRSLQATFLYLLIMPACCAARRCLVIPKRGKNNLTGLMRNHLFPLFGYRWDAI